MTSPDELYHQAIVEHDRHPHHHGPLPGATHAATIDNPLCGDVVTVRLIVDGDRIAAIAFEGRGCALSRAAASMMTERLMGAALADAPALAGAFERFVAEPREAAIPAELGELAAFRGVRAVRSRRTCATLPFRALVSALATARG
jgi:nitrogen fixation protein NifU and related proteins